MKNILRKSLVLSLGAVAIFALTPTSLMAVQPDFPGKPVTTPPTSPPGNPDKILPEREKCIIHNAIEYCEVTSETGRVWLDRNLGAARVCEALDDDACYGDYYQWGRNTDGHEDYLSGTTSTQATNVYIVGHSDFITSSGDYDYDWAHAVDADGSIRAANWSKENGRSVCPVGYRVPTKDELGTEIEFWTAKDNAGAFGSVLKLPSAGLRSDFYGEMYEQGSAVLIWSGSVSETDTEYSYSLVALPNDGNNAPDDIYAGLEHGPRAFGMSVRCIKD